MANKTGLQPVISGATAANLGSAAASINTVEKYAGKLARDTTNNRLYVARGAGSTDPWDLADGSASITPA
jgi:hypothetical protein